MSLVVTHTFVSGQPDGTDPTKIQPTSHWNAQHTLSGVASATQGGTGSAFFTAAGPTSGRTYTFPDASCNVLTDHAAVTAAQGGTGLAAYAVGDLLYASAVTPTLSRLAAVAAGSVLVSAGINTAPAWSASPTLASIAFGVNPASAGTVRLPNGTANGLVARKADNSADVNMMYVSAAPETIVIDGGDFGTQIGATNAFLRLGGITASFPGLLRDTIFIKLKLGDNSGVSGAATASLPAAASARDGIIGFDTTLNAFVYYVGGSRFKLVGSSF